MVNNEDLVLILLLWVVFVLLMRYTLLRIMWVPRTTMSATLTEGDLQKILEGYDKKNHNAETKDD